MRATEVRRRLAPIASYYRRVLVSAWRETATLVAARLALSVLLVVLVFAFSFVLSSGGTAASLEVSLASVAAIWSLVFLWYCIVIPPRIERLLRQKERDLDAVRAQREVQAAMREIAFECRRAASTSDEDVIGQTQALALRAQEILERYKSSVGESYVNEAAELSRVAGNDPPTTKKDAVAQLRALATLIDSHIYSGRYY
jgi:hypothetical protein